MLKSRYELLNESYTEIMQDLQILILSRYSSIKKFAKVAGINYENLNKAFVNYRGKEISIGLYLQILEVLFPEYYPQTPPDNPVKHIKGSFREYLLIDNNSVWLSIHLLKKA